MKGAQIVGHGQLTVAPRVWATAARQVAACPCGDGHAGLVEHLMVGMNEAMAADEEVLGEGEQSVDPAGAWHLLTHSLYGSGDLVTLAVREAMQNSIDAIRKSYRRGLLQKGEGVFSVTWDAGTGKLVFEDNGIGMDADTLFNVFFKLAGSVGKQDDEDATGGFGAAKAVIIGLSANRDVLIHSQDNGARLVPGSLKFLKLRMPMRRGTRIEIGGIDPKLLSDYYYSSFYRSSLSVPRRIEAMLYLSDVPDVTLRFNGRRVGYAWDGRRGNISEFSSSKGYDWGESVTGEIRSYSLPPGEAHNGSGSIYVRLNGLLQFVTGVSDGNSRFEYDFVIDFKLGYVTHKGKRVRLAPKIPGYPFSMSRDAFSNGNPQAYGAYESFRRQAISEGRQLLMEHEWEMILPSEDDEREAKGSEAFQKALAEFGLGGELEDLHKDLVQVAQEGHVGGPRGQAAEPDASPDDLPHRDGAGLKESSELANFRDYVELARRAGGTPEAAQELVNQIVQHAKDHDAPVEYVVEMVQRRVADGQQPSDWALEETINWIVGYVAKVGEESAEGPIAGGVIAQAIGQAVVDQLNVPKAEKERIYRKANPNPFGKAGALKIAKNRYDADKAKQFKRQYKKHMPLLALWDFTVRLVAKEAAIHRKLGTGFVLDNTARAICTSTNGQDRWILINPDWWYTYFEAHKERPYMLAQYLHGAVVHELTHVPFLGTSESHGDEFAKNRESLGFDTANLVPIIEAAVCRTYKRQVKCGKTSFKGLEDKIRLQKRQLRELRTKLDAVQNVAAATQEAAAQPTMGIGKLSQGMIHRLEQLVNYQRFTDWLREGLSGGSAAEITGTNNIQRILDALSEDQEVIREAAQQLGHQPVFSRHEHTAYLPAALAPYAAQASRYGVQLLLQEAAALGPDVLRCAQQEVHTIMSPREVKRVGTKCLGAAASKRYMPRA